ncbi:protein of unknown function [Cupriavidus taiwanensis]|nr:protein of unknown function [Cupriavidus taiwanensis]
MDSASGRVRHHQPQFQPGTDRVGARPFPGQGVEAASELQPATGQGQPVRHRARGQWRNQRRHRAVGPYRRGAGGRPGLDHRPVQAGGARRQAVRPRHLRHEGLYRHQPVAAARHPRGPPARAGALRAVVRRRDRLHGRALPAGRTARARRDSRRLHRRRTHQHARDRRAQGHQRLPLLRARPGRAFVADAARRQRHRIRGAADLLHPRHRRRVQGQRPLRPGLRRALHHRADRHHPGRHCAQHDPGAVRVRVRVPQPARRRSGSDLRAHPGLCQRRAAAEDARRTCRCRPDAEQDRRRAVARRGRAGSDHATGTRADRGPRHQQGGLRHRGRAVPARGHSGGGMRARRYPAGAQAGRVRCAGTAGRVRGVPAQGGGQPARELTAGVSNPCSPLPLGEGRNHFAFHGALHFAERQPHRQHQTNNNEGDPAWPHVAPHPVPPPVSPSPAWPWPPACCATARRRRRLPHPPAPMRCMPRSKPAPGRWKSS